jgi:hypothetical protein
MRAAHRQGNVAAMGNPYGITLDEANYTKGVAIACSAAWAAIHFLALCVGSALGDNSSGTKRRGDSMQPRSVILSTKRMRQGISCRRGESTNEQRLSSGFGFVDPGELTLNGAERKKSQRGESDRICESL